MRQHSEAATAIESRSQSAGPYASKQGFLGGGSFLPSLAPSGRSVTTQPPPLQPGAFIPESQYPMDGTMLNDYTGPME